jgi:hypothetical protein
VWKAKNLPGLGLQKKRWPRSVFCFILCQTTAMDNSNGGRQFPFWAVISTAIGVCGLYLSYKQYAENKELKEMQRELTAMQLKEKRVQTASQQGSAV